MTTNPKHFASLNLNNLFLFVLITSFLSISNTLSSQCDYERYRSFVFENIDVSYNVEYGVSPAWNWPFFNIDLEMDIYQPQGDSIDKRPAIIWCHSGGFITGDKGVDDMTSFCESYAKRGYVAVSINYRQGFNLLSNSSAERAVYRGIQDTRAAYRYLVENADALNIDPTKIFIGGSSAGGFCSLHTAYSDDDERPDSTYDFPDLGCLDCEGNDYDHEVNPVGIINLWGAIGDTTWIDPDEDYNLYMAHGTNDGTVPYDVGEPFGVFIFADVYGSLPISQRLDSQGKTYDFTTVEDGEHEPHGTDNGTFNDPPTPFWDQLNEELRVFSVDIIKPAVPALSSSYEICLGDTLELAFESLENELCYFGDGEVIVLENSLKLVFTELGSYSGIVHNENCIKALSEGLALSFEVVATGCTDSNACNYDPTVSCDDGSCEYLSCSTCIGDVNLDGFVNILDLVSVSSNFGCTSDCVADADGDGEVNIVDLVIVSSNFGIICGE